MSELLNLKQASKKVGIPYQTFRFDVIKGKYDCKKIRKSYLFSDEDIAKILNLKYDKKPIKHTNKLNMVEASVFVGLSYQVFRFEVLDGKVKHKRNGRNYIFSTKDLISYLQENSVKQK